MPSEMERKLAKARNRMAADSLLKRLARSLAAAGLAVAVLLIVNNLFYPLGLPPDGELLAGWPAWFGAENLRWLAVNWLILPACIAAAICYSALALLAGRTSLMRTAISVDGRLGLRECFSTAVELAGLNSPKGRSAATDMAGLSRMDDPFARAAVNQAEGKAGKLSDKDLAGQFPVRLTRTWLWPAGVWTAAVLLAFFLPVFDLFGAIARRDADAKQVQEDNKAKVEIKQAAQTIQTLVKQLGSEDLKEDLEKLKELAERSRGEELRREAIKKLTELSDKLKDELKGDKKMDAAQALKDVLKQLKGSTGPNKQEIKNSLAKGQIKEAIDKLEEMRKQIEEGKLTEEQAKALQQELEDIARQLENVNYEQQAEKALRDAGLSQQDAQKKAGMSDEQLREELKKEGYTDEQIEKIMEKLQALREACNQCKKLAGSMPRDGRPMSAGELARLLEELELMEGQMNEAELARALLEEIEGQIVRLGGQGDGEGEGEGFAAGDQGVVGPWKAGNQDRQGGTGGPGQGLGKRPSDDKGNTDFTKIGVKNTPTAGGPIIASKVFKGPQVKGEAKQQFEAAVQAAKDGASEAVKDNKIPKKYESAVKKYFGDLEQTGKSGN
ncbi:MAG: hypothetical protein HZA50_08925 [Planctomycetes bacterium]|nr:hypothetical protein [Planctomycetota bacterium]